MSVEKKHINQHQGHFNQNTSFKWGKKNNCALSILLLSTKYKQKANRKFKLCFEEMQWLSAWGTKQTVSQTIKVASCMACRQCLSLLFYPDQPSLTCPTLYPSAPDTLVNSSTWQINLKKINSVSYITIAMILCFSYLVVIFKRMGKSKLLDFLGDGGSYIPTMFSLCVTFFHSPSANDFFFKFEKHFCKNEQTTEELHFYGLATLMLFKINKF